MFTINDKKFNLDQAHERVLLVGQEIAPRGLVTYEVLNLSYDYLDTMGPGRIGFNRMLGYVEGLNLIAGNTDLAALYKVAPATTEKFHLHNTMSWYAEAVSVQTEKAIRYLKDDSFSRKAVVYVGGNRPRPEDQTCTMTIQFLIRDEQLITIVNMRSWDLYLGLPYDVAMFAMLAQAVRQILGLKSGRLIFHAGSAHIYCHNYKPVRWRYTTREWVEAIGAKHWRDLQAWAEKQLEGIKAS